MNSWGADGAKRCPSCHYYVPKVSTIGVLGTNGKGWMIDSRMSCEQNMAAVSDLRGCSFYEREPGSD
jgi:hypothetical protein